MPDITMCLNNTCTKQESCYRHKATPNDWQSWSNFTQTKGKCVNYIKVYNYENKRHTTNSNPSGGFSEL